MKLALGTVQFGLPYGITNRANARVSDGQIEKILSYAYSKGIHTLDTASEYGVSETILGKIIETQPSLEFSIITKTPRIQEKKYYLGMLCWLRKNLPNPALTYSKTICMV